MLDTPNAATPLRVETPPPTRATVATRDYSWTVAMIAMLAWVTFMAISVAVQPPPADAAAPIPLSAAMPGVAFQGAMLAAATGLGLRRRFGLWATVTGGVVMVGAAVLCYLGGHTGAWIAVQLGSGAGLTATATGLLRLS